MKHSQVPAKRSSCEDIDQFLRQLDAVTNQSAPHHRGRLLFALDATASRQPTWDRACQLQGDMFVHTRGLGALDIQICFYRGYDQFKVSPWYNNPADLVRAMSRVSCLGGHTQIRRVLSHALREHKRQPISALVFIGDCLEEPLDDLCHIAGQLGLVSVPLFIFQEGRDAAASNGFKQLARLSNGAHCQFDSHGAQVLGELLNAVAVYATGGRKALQSFGATGSAAVKKLCHKLENPNA